MAATQHSRSLRWGSLVAMVIFFAVAIAVLVAVPSSPVNRTHMTMPITPGAITLPPTAPSAVTPTLTIAPNATASR